MSREDILLKEYEVCQQSIASHSSRFWIIVGIFIGVNTALIGWIAIGLLSNSPAANDSAIITQNENWPVLICLLGSGMISILMFLLFWLRRVNWFLRITYHRMRQIETHLGMWKNRIINKLDTAKKRKEENEVIPLGLQKPPMLLRETTSFYGIIITLISVWGFFIAKALFMIG